MDNATKKEYRAVYAKENGLQSGWGPTRPTMTAALDDAPENKTGATPQRIVGVEVREVTQFVPVPLEDILRVG